MCPLSQSIDCDGMQSGLHWNGFDWSYCWLRQSRVVSTVVERDRAFRFLGEESFNCRLMLSWESTPKSFDAQFVINITASLIRSRSSNAAKNSQSALAERSFKAVSAPHYWVLSAHSLISRHKPSPLQIFTSTYTASSPKNYLL